MTTTLTLVSYLADHAGFGPQSCSLYTLVGPFPTKSNEELVTMDGFPSLGQPCCLAEKRNVGKMSTTLQVPTQNILSDLER